MQMVELWGCDISRFVWFCAAGESFFPGAGLLAVSLVLGGSAKKVWIFISYVLLIIAVILIVLSATPLPVWFYSFWAVCVLCYLFLSREKTHVKKMMCITAIGLCIVAILIELPFHFQPRVERREFKRMYIIGDSVSAGIGAKDERPWPGIFRDKYGVEVVDLSVAGATVTSAKNQAQRIDRPDAVVFIEIGGNDLFEGTPYKFFEEGLSGILSKATESGRLAVMLELPLRPRDIRYGRIQRRLADKYGVVLVPKHFFAGIFATKDATIDLVHLSPAGHQLMAEMVWNLLKYSLGRDEESVGQ